MLLRCIRAENRKLRRSPIWLLFLAVPAISAVYGTFNYNMNLEILTHGWYDLWTQYTLFYAIFFFAPLIGVYAAYLWRLEHRGHNWNLIMTAPVRPFCLYFAKFCVVTKMAILTQLWLLLLFVIGGKLGAGLAGRLSTAGDCSLAPPGRYWRTCHHCVAATSFYGHPQFCSAGAACTGRKRGGSAGCQ